MTAPAQAAPEAETGAARARSPADVRSDQRPQLERVPAPLPDETVVSLDGVEAGGLEAVLAEWGADGGAVVLTGKRPFVDLTARASFRPDGSLDGRVDVRASIGLFGMPMGEATWSVAGWEPSQPLASPGVALRGTRLAVDLAALPPEAALTTPEALVASREGQTATIDLPADAVPEGQPLSPRMAELFRGLLGADVGDLTVHPDSPVQGAPGFVSNEDLFFAPGVYGVDSPETLRVLDAAVRAALAGLTGPVGDSAPEAPAPEAPAPSGAGADAVFEVPTTGDAPAPEPAAGAAGAAGAVAEVATPLAADEALPDAEAGGVGAASEAPEAEAGGAAPVAEVLMPEAPTEPTPPAAARGGAVAGGAGGAARAATDLPSAEETTDDAHGAVEEPVAETAARAREELAAELGERPAPSPEIVALAERIRTAIRENRPEDEDELLRTDPTDEARDAGATVTSTVDGEVQDASGAYDEMGNPPAGSPALSPTPVAAVDPSSPGMGVDAASAAPDPIPAADTSLDADVAATDRRIEDSGIDTRVTEEIPDGPFADARAARGELGELAERTPEEIHAEEQGAIDSAQADMAQLQLLALASMRAARSGTVGSVGEGQDAATAGEEASRQTVSERAQTLYDDAERRVEELLDPLSRTAIARWDAGLTRLSRQFHDALDRVQRWIEERHSGVVGTIVAIGDYIAGLPRWVTDEYNRAERAFGDGVADLLLDISSDVNGVLGSARAIVQSARTEIDGLFDQMEAEFPEEAARERARFAGMLDGLDNRVDDAETSFVRDVSSRAITAVNEAHAAVEARRQEAGGLIGQVIAAINEFIDDPVRAIINGLLRLVGIPPGEFWALLAQIEQVAGDIADDPENFINNLVAGVKLGFQQFFDNFGMNLIRSFWQWLFSGLETPIPMPTGYDPMSLMTFALQLMGITWPNIREILVRHVGPAAVDVLEAAWDLLSILIEQGPQGIVDLIKEQLSPENIVGMILDAAIEYLVETLIVQAAQWVFSLLNPAGAVAQAIRLIYQVCAWIFRNAARIFSLVQAVVGGIANVIAGNISGMATTVERALVQMMVVAIDFLAGLLGLGGLPDEVAAVIVRLQTYVLSIVERIVVFFVSRARALLARLGIGGDEEEGGDGNDDDELGTTVRFSADHESHRLFFRTNGPDATLMLASTPVPIENKIAEWQGKLQAGEPTNPQDFAEASTLLGNLSTIVSEAGAEGDALAVQFLQAAADAGDDIEPPSDDALENKQRAIAGLISRLAPLFGEEDRTEEWLADMAAFLPAEAATEMNVPYSRWQGRLAEFTVGNEEGDPRIWDDAVLEGTRAGAETYIAASSTHRLLLPYFQTAPGERAVRTGAFSDYAFSMSAGHPVAPNLRRNYGNAAVTRLQQASAWTIQPYERVTQDYKDRLDRRIDRMAFQERSPSGGRIDWPTERIPDHDRYLPVMITEPESSGGVRTIHYRTSTGQEFTSATDSNDGLTITVSGENLRFMSGRGVTQDSPAYRTNNGFDRSHIIANEFGGTGYATGGNLVTASSHYNQDVMRHAERAVGDSIANFARQHHLDATQVSFSMTVTVRFGALLDATLLARIKQQPWFPADRAGADLDAEIRAKIESGQIHRELMRIMSVTYSWTFSDPAGEGSALSIGPDLWLLING